MKAVALTLALIASVALAHAAGPVPGTPPTVTERYALGLLFRGPAWTPTRTPATDSIQAGHMANIGVMWEARRLVAAGPCSGDPSLRGIFVWQVDSLAEIPAMLAGDPAIASGRLRADVHRWHAEPGIGVEYRAKHERGERDSMVSFSLVLLRRGPSYTSNGTPEEKRLVSEHAKHAAKLRADGLLVLGGTTAGTSDLDGMLVFNADTAQARRLVDADPAVKSGRFTAQVWKWWCALGTVPGH
jgi:uncharacterized protein YciI